MKFETESFNEETKRKSEKNREQWLHEREWHPWFAWHSVILGDRWKSNETAWLETVERRLSYYDRQSLPHWFHWDIRNHEYRAIKKESTSQTRPWYHVIFRWL